MCICNKSDRANATSIATANGVDAVYAGDCLPIGGPDPKSHADMADCAALGLGEEGFCQPNVIPMLSTVQ